MKTLVFDTETTGFPNKHSPLDHEGQPHLIQIAAFLTEGDEILNKLETIIHCPIEVPDEAFKVHGISRERSQEKGIPLATTLAAFNDLLITCDRLVAHNMRFDLQIMKIAYARRRITDAFIEEVPKFCTMLTVAPIMKRFGKRWTLDSTYRHYVDVEGFSAAHSAGADTMACFKILRALEKEEIEIRNI